MIWPSKTSPSSRAPSPPAALDHEIAQAEIVEIVFLGFALQGQPGAVAATSQNVEAFDQQEALCRPAVEGQNVTAVGDRRLDACAVRDDAVTAGDVAARVDPQAARHLVGAGKS
jgi:hypothetical protein